MLFIAQSYKENKWLFHVVKSLPTYMFANCYGRACGSHNGQLCLDWPGTDWLVGLSLPCPKPSVGDSFWLSEGLFTPMVCCTTGRSSYSSLFYLRIIVWDAIIFEIVPKQCNGCNWIHLKCSSPMCLQTFSQSGNNHQLKAGGQALSAPM